jgi:electron transport complex protein RnfE
MKPISKEFTKGLWEENPVLVLVLGMCPTLAVTSSMKNGMGMGLATLFVLLGSNLVVSLVRNIIPKKVRIPCYIVIIATFVTLVGMITSAYFPAIDKALGIFIPLIVVNCIVLGRAEAFASKNGVFRSVVDGLGMGVGFTLTLMALGGVREFLGGGTLFEIQMVPGWQHEFMIMKFAPGAFIMLGFFLAGMNWISIRRARKNGKTYTAPQELDCAHCRICMFDTDD